MSGIRGKRYLDENGNEVLTGGLRTAKTNATKYGPEYYKRLGRMGGSVKHPSTRYFFLHPEVAKIAGRKGGTISRRGPAKKKPL